MSNNPRVHNMDREMHRLQGCMVEVECWMEEMHDGDVSSLPL